MAGAQDVANAIALSASGLGPGVVAGAGDATPIQNLLGKEDLDPAFKKLLAGAARHFETQIVQTVRLGEGTVKYVEDVKI